MELELKTQSLTQQCSCLEEPLMTATADSKRSVAIALAVQAVVPASKPPHLSAIGLVALRFLAHRILAEQHSTAPTPGPQASPLDPLTLADIAVAIEATLGSDTLFQPQHKKLE